MSINKKKFFKKYGTHLIKVVKIKLSVVILKYSDLNHFCIKFTTYGLIIGFQCKLIINIKFFKNFQYIIRFRDLIKRRLIHF